MFMSSPEVNGERPVPYSPVNELESLGAKECILIMSHHGWSYPIILLIDSITMFH